MSVAEMIKGHQLFASLNFDEVEQVSTFSGPKLYSAGDTIFRRDDQGTHFFVVLEGQVQLLLPSPDSESRLVVGQLDKGSIFGVSPLLGFERYTTTATCTRDGSVLAVEVAPFRHILEDNSVVGMNIMGVMARAYFSRYIETLGRFQNVVHDLALH